MTVILDCCHSGSGTRAIETVVRRGPTDLRHRPIQSFLVAPGDPPLRAASADPGTTILGASRSRHVLLSACRDDEEAKEYFGNGKYRGAFSFFLLESLKRRPECRRIATSSPEPRLVSPTR